VEKGGDSTHPCRRRTPTVNGYYLTLPNRAQTSEQEYNDLKASITTSEYHTCITTRHRDENIKMIEAKLVRYNWTNGMKQPTH